MGRSFKNLALSAARAADAKKGENILLLHVARISPLSDYMLIATASSRPHIETLEHEIESTARAIGFTCLHRNKPLSDIWRVLDYGGLLVHLMTASARQFYALEKLHHRARVIPWQENAFRRLPRKKAAVAEL